MSPTEMTAPRPGKNRRARRGKNEALRAAIEELVGTGQPVPRCRNRKMRPVVSTLSNFPLPVSVA